MIVLYVPMLENMKCNLDFLIETLPLNFQIEDRSSFKKLENFYLVVKVSFVPYLADNKNILYELCSAASWLTTYNYPIMWVPCIKHASPISRILVQILDR